MIRLLYTEDVRERWHEIEPFIDMPLKYSMGTLSKDEILEALSSGKMQGFLVCSPDLVGVCVTQIKTYPSVKTLEVLLLGGDGFDDWGAELIALLERFCSLTGCNRMSAVGRRGWTRKLSQFGWDERLVIVAKEIRS